MSSLFEDNHEDLDPFIEGQVDALNTHDILMEPKESALYLSNETTETDFLELIQKEKLPHAVIFTGQKGIGKSTFAYRLSRFLFKYGKQENSGASLFGEDAPIELPETMSVDQEDPIFRRILSGGHADFLCLEPAEGKKGLDVQQIRKVAPFLRKTASEDGGWRIVLIDDADTMNRNAQNALLKILEEPPKQTLLILISHNNAAFLPTIISRVRTVYFNAPTEDIFKDLIRRHDADISADNIKFLYEYSSGSIGNSVSFIEYNGLDLFTSIEDILKGFPQADFEKIHLFSEQFSRNVKDAHWNNFSHMLIWIFQTLSLSKAKHSELPDILYNLNNLNTLWSLEEMVEICQMLQRILNRATFANLDKRQTALEVFMILQQSIDQK